MRKVSAIPLSEAALRLLSARRVLLLIHRNPDGDAVGSGFALAEMLRGLGKETFVVSGDPIPERLAFLLRGQTDCTYRPGMEEEYDLLCAVDTASPAQLGSLSPLMEKVGLSLDHHGMNEPFSDHYTLPDASAAGEVLFSLSEEFSRLGKPSRTADVSRLLFAAIASDTGSFQYANTGRKTLLAAAELVGEIAAATDGGMDLSAISHALFSSHSVSELRAQRLAIDALRITRNGALAAVVLTGEMLAESGVSQEDLGSIVDLPRSVTGVQIALSVRPFEGETGKWRVSARASADLDVASVCRSFGGGGHRRAAGCTVEAADAESAYRTVEAAFGALLREEG